MAEINTIETKTIELEDGSEIEIYKKRPVFLGVEKFPPDKIHSVREPNFTEQKSLSGVCING